MISKELSRKGILLWIEKAAWALFFVSLPVTGFPYLPPALGGVALVRPLAIYPLIILLIVATIPRLIGEPVPKPFVPLLVFVIVVVAGSLWAFLGGVDGLLGVSLLDRTIRSLLTLGLGVAFYMTVALLPRNHQDMRYCLRWLYAGFAIALLWGSLQVVYVLHYSPEYFQWMGEVQKYISIRRLIPKRVSGLTYEPNWFAEQISFLLMPWLFASVLSRTTVFRWKSRWITIELLLLIWSVFVLIFTYSRAGLVVCAAVLFLGVLLYRPSKVENITTAKLGWARLAKRVALGGMTILVLGGLIFWVGSRNGYFSRLWRYWTDEESTGEYWTYIAFSQRFIYWETAFHMFESHPLFGVGVGNYAFHFEEMLPDRPLFKMPELLRLITPEQGRARLVTAKNLYARLMAETGLVGTASFVVFLISMLGWVIFFWLSPFKEGKFWGIAGILGFVAFALAAFSFDSFALPNMWVMFGLFTAASRVFAHTEAGGPVKVTK
ncbi:MAG TPA: O-antigen ligase family protein [Anaerolineales bacterium]|nr:O-antigen ligase family protein [Anaerolineales bacterium]